MFLWCLRTPNKLSWENLRAIRIISINIQGEYQNIDQWNVLKIKKIKNNSKNENRRACFYISLNNIQLLFSNSKYKKCIYKDHEMYTFWYHYVVRIQFWLVLLIRRSIQSNTAMLFTSKRTYSHICQEIRDTSRQRNHNKLGYQF